MKLVASSRKKTKVSSSNEKIAVFASGNGSNFQVIAEQFPVEFVFSDHRDAYVLERADKLGVLSYAFELKEFDNKADYEQPLSNSWKSTRLTGFV